MFKNKKQGYRGHEGRKDKAGRADQSQKKETAEKTGSGGQVSLCSQPLIDADYRKKSSHGKFNACGVKGDHLSHDCADDGSGHPVALVKEGNKKEGKLPLAVRKAPGAGNRAEQGIGFICEGEYHVRTCALHFLKTVDKGQAVKGVAAVDQQGHNGGGEISQTAREDARQGKLHGSGIDQKADKKGP